MSSHQHLAAILPSKAAGAFKVAQRPTPEPDLDELVIEVKSIALNPIDYYQRDMGFPDIAHYPAVLGWDVGGIVISAGSSVPSDAPKPGTRVAVLATSYFKQAPDYGAFQERVLAPAANVVTLPQGMSFNEASLLPVAVSTAWAAWYFMGLPRDTAYKAAEKKGMLVWGGASSIGSATIQVAKLMGFSVYATASGKHHQYLNGLGATRMFDYKAEDVVGSIVKAAKEDGVIIEKGFDAVGQVQLCLDILKETKGDGTAQLATAVPLSKDTPKMEGVEVNWVAPPEDEKERMEFYHFVFGVWLKEKLEKGEFVPSPKIQVVGKGLESLQKGLDELKKGVSGVKLVVEL